MADDKTIHLTIAFIPCEVQKKKPLFRSQFARAIASLMGVKFIA